MCHFLLLSAIGGTLAFRPPLRPLGGHIPEQPDGFSVPTSQSCAYFCSFSINVGSKKKKKAFKC